MSTLPNTSRPSAPERLKTRWRAYLAAGWPSALALLCIYPATNWLAAQQTRRYKFFLDIELSIPFHPEWIFIYISIYLLLMLPPFFINCAQLRRLGAALLACNLLSAVCFVLFPAPIGYTRVLPEEEPYRRLFELVFLLDKPFNTAPSLHISCLSCAVLMLAERSSIGLRALWFLWLALIAASTLLVHQHHVLDVVSGFALAVLLHRWFAGKTCPMPAPNDAGSNKNH